MPRRSIFIPLVVVAVVCAAVVATAVWRQLDTGSAIQTGALGVWQEQTGSDPLGLTISAGPDQSDSTGYWVTSPRAFKGAFPAKLDGDRILVLGENAGDVVWAITYDEGADALLVTRPATGERHILRRVSR